MNSIKQSLIMHVNYCDQGQTIEEICCKAAKWGFDGIEFRRKRTNIKESAKEYLDCIGKYYEKYGLKEIIRQYVFIEL